MSGRKREAEPEERSVEEGSMQHARFVRVMRGAAVRNGELLGERVGWVRELQVFFANPAFKLAAEEDFLEGRCVGMDAASALAVEALEVRPGMGVLDLCCAPGMKLAAIAELMDKQGVLVGVDVAPHRLNTTAAILRKYKACLKDDQERDWDLSIWQSDGRSFDPIANRGLLIWSTALNHIFIGGKELKVPRKRAGKGLRKILNNHSKTEMETKSFPALFDRVLVDAECTTDARAHVPTSDEATYKKRRWTGDDGSASPEELLETEKLQLEILTNGFRLLKPGGFLIYSTCSMLEGQNEGVLSKFMDSEPKAKLLPPVPALGDLPSFVEPSKTLGNLGWRLTPTVSGTSGLFIARLMKI